MELRTFSRIRMRASTRVPHGNPSTATPVEDVCVCARETMFKILSNSTIAS